MIDMKKVIAVILALVLALSVSAIAFADGEDTTSKALQCPICGMLFNSDGTPIGGTEGKSYNDHIKTHYTYFDEATGNGYFECQECHRRFENPDAYLQDQKTHIGRTDYECAICHQKFANQELYNEHMKTHSTNADHRWSQYIGLTLPELFDKFFGYMQSSGATSTILDLFWDLYNRVMEFIVNGVAGSGAGEAEVAGAVDKLDLAIGKLNLPEVKLTGINDFMTAIKQKIKDFYAHDEAVVVEEVTNAEAPVETGSATAGIAVFAAITAAAAAAYVCSKKKA